MRELPKLVSVVIPAYNARAVIDTQLEALAAQDYAGEMEVVVGDNRSTDGLREHLADHPLRDRLRLRRVEAADAQCASHARNVAAAASGGEFLAFCDADDRAHVGWLSALVEAAREADMVSGALETGSINAPEVAERVSVEAPERGFEFPGFLPFASGSNCGVWRDAFEAVGGWDESFRRAGEDMDFSWRIQLAGYTLGHAPTAITAYRLKTTYRELWDQSLSYGEVDPRLYKRYRAAGFRRNLLALPVVAVLLFIRNPLLPTAVTRLPRGQWLAYLARAFGRVRGSIQHRVWFV
ncbi:cellulose synthase/poly-beta-1,6-N-acetylglucosamine synthase-like glycosyltransferase [Rhodococcus sp. OK611]|uniref:glycosyltransferase n=1 Tax=unclassified Rhodococcus (in: high G+C Gram-positive bacteria) TaxID=192944 RepID=UPI000BCA783A|nr:MULTISPECIES: glycosyltransferase [unclassified Rhodococcus (in: high G+C Gram-positive bacteria)]PTR37532.1 cellulose synthase/poly-beta-1,6-N-acetylglucosamine synthase-like glycosyltransferase [Rhodococcus sp. OK611]SNX93438.1 Glycosyltransferase, catalytic subunit of cellulose synthase and poly-beta-1,6-N-acetylglucosamine synthase [Rhodococcus sp. OK270]